MTIPAPSVRNSGESDDVLILSNGEFAVGYYSYRSSSWYIYGSPAGGGGKVHSISEWWPLPSKGTGIR